MDKFQGTSFIMLDYSKVSIQILFNYFATSRIPRRQELFMKPMIIHEDVARSHYPNAIIFIRC